jgi:nitrite reductase (NADH) small subunit
MIDLLARPVAVTTEYLLGPQEQIPLGEGRDFEIEGRLITVFRLRDGGVYATQATCPHRKGPLADGLIGGTTIVCPFHAWKFDLRSGEALFGTCGIATYPVRLSETGALLLTLGPDTPTQTDASGDAAANLGANLFSREEIEGQPVPAAGS